MKIILGYIPQPVLGIPLVVDDFMDSIIGFLFHDTQNRNIFGGWAKAATAYIPQSRNSLASSFLDKTDGDWLWMCDWDVKFTPLSVYQLLDAADPIKRPVISGLYVTWFGSDGKLRPCWMAHQDGQDYVPIVEWTPGALHELTVCGMGFTMIHRSVLEKLREIHKDDPWQWFGHDIVGADRTGEDLTFCKRARDAGFSVWGHAGVLIGHCKGKVLTALDASSNSLDHPFANVGVKKKFLNVGGGDRNTPLPPEFSGWDHVLLDIDQKVNPDIVADARHLHIPSSWHQTNQSWSYTKIWGDNTKEVLPPTEEHKGSTFIPDESFDAIYCSHNLEHYHSHEVPKVLDGFKRVLKPDGNVLIRVPNVKAVMKEVAEGTKELDDVLYESPAGPITCQDVIYGYGKEIAKSGQEYFSHRTGFTASLLKRKLEAAGFADVKVDENGLELEASGVKNATLVL